MSKEEREIKQTGRQKKERDLFGAEKEQFLAGKPSRMIWWLVMIYLIPFMFFAGGGLAILGGTLRTIMHEASRTDSSFGEAILFHLSIMERRELVLMFVGTMLIPACYLPTILRMSHRIVLEENGLVFRDSLRREHKIIYAEIISYKFRGGKQGGVAIHTHDGKYFFYGDMTGWKYLCDEIKLKVGEDKEVK